MIANAIKQLPRAVPRSASSIYAALGSLVSWGGQQCPTILITPTILYPFKRVLFYHQILAFLLVTFFAFLFCNFSHIFTPYIYSFASFLSFVKDCSLAAESLFFNKFLTRERFKNIYIMNPGYSSIFNCQVLLMAAPRPTLPLLSCSQNFPRAS